MLHHGTIYCGLARCDHKVMGLTKAPGWTPSTKQRMGHVQVMLPP